MTDLDTLRRLRALKVAKSEIANSSATSQDSTKCPPSITS
jgi:hypothetical protein